MSSLQQLAHRPSTLITLLIIASALLIAGLVMPIMTIKTLVFMRHSFSILSGIYDLLIEGKILLFLIIGLFSIIFPLAKLGFLFALLLGHIRHTTNTQRYLTLLHDYGRWAMLDVMVVAILIVALKLGAMASVKVHSGLYVFSLAVLMIMGITHLTTKFLKPD